MLSGKDIFGQGEEIVRIALYKCRIGHTPQGALKWNPKKKKLILVKLHSPCKVIDPSALDPF